MSKKNINIEVLIIKAAAKAVITPVESAQLAAWRKKAKYHSDLPERLRDLPWVTGQLQKMHQYSVNRVWERVAAGMKEKPAPPILFFKKKFMIVAAAIVLLLLGTGIYLAVQKLNKPKRMNVPVVTQETELAGTVLTLSNGTRVVLDPISQDSLLAMESKTAIRKPDSNRLIYRAVGSLRQEEDTSYNELRTTKMSPYALELADGSKVWVNSSSTIRYPVAFSGKERSVDLSGEADFLISRHLQASFRVIINNATIEVLGTHFNVSAYADDPEKHIALLEGSVKVTGKKNSLLLRPMEQVWIGKDDSLHKTALRDTLGMLDWRQQLFQFDGKPLAQILREVGRSYGLKLPDLDSIKGAPISGIYSRKLPSTTILRTIETLERKQIQFKIQGDSLRILVH